MLSLSVITKNGASIGAGRKFLAQLLLAGLCACTAPSTPVQPPAATVTASEPRTPKDSVSSDQLVVPGQSIGQVRIGDADSTVIARLGKPDSSDAAMGKAWLFWISKNEAHDRTGVFTTRKMGTDDETARVSQVLVSAPFFLTKEGARTGDGLEALRKAYPSLTQTAKLSGGAVLYDARDRGIAFIVGGDGSCKAIVVHRPGVAVQAISEKREGERAW